MSDNAILSFQEIETVLRIIDATPRNGTVEISVGDVKLSVTRGDAHIYPAGPIPAETQTSTTPPVPVEEGEASGPATVPAPTKSGSASQANRTASGPVESTELASTNAEGHLIEAPMTGVFYRQPEPGAAPFVEEGERVEAGDVVAIIEVMKLMNRLTTPVAGTVRQVCVESEQLVEHGTPLFIIDPDADMA